MQAVTWLFQLYRSADSDNGRAVAALFASMIAKSPKHLRHELQLRSVIKAVLMRGKTVAEPGGASRYVQRDGVHA
jgi:hypothetical protein